MKNFRKWIFKLFSFSGITSFTDLSKEEFNRMYTSCCAGLQDESCALKTDADSPDTGAPDALDYR